MKVVELKNAGRRLGGCVTVAQKHRVVITRDGKPVAVLVGVAGADLEDLAWSSDPEFWKLIEERRRQRSVPLAEARRRLGVPRRKGRAKTRG